VTKKADARSILMSERPRLRIEEVFDIDLNSNQYQHYRAARTFVGFPKEDIEPKDIDATREWLANPNRGQGRTTLLALCFLEWGVASAGARVSFFDHNSTSSGQRVMGKVLRELVEKHPAFRSRIEFHKHDSSFTFRREPWR
jgi:hypothetical protein